MRIPHTINRSTLTVTGPSEEAKSQSREVNRRLRAEDAEWDAGIVPSLLELCLRKIPVPVTGKPPCDLRNIVLETLSLDIPLPLAVDVLEDGIYWQRRAKSRWPHFMYCGKQWKTFFMEKHTEEVLEKFIPEGYDEEDVNDICYLGENYVRKLDIKELQVKRRFRDPEVDPKDILVPDDRLNLCLVLKGLPLLTELTIQFTIRNIGEEYRKVLLEFTAQDCKNLGDGIAASKSLQTFTIQHSLLDDSKLAVLVNHMTPNESLHSISFPHCIIKDEGAAAIAKLLTKKTNIKYLNLSNNHIGVAGIQALSLMLTQQKNGLQSLNLSLNHLGDDGAKFLLSALEKKAVVLKNLNLSCTNLGEDTGLLLAVVLSRNNTLEDIDLSNNLFNENVENVLQENLRGNKMLKYLDLRMTHIDYSEIESILTVNRLRNL